MVGKFFGKDAVALLREMNTVKCKRNIPLPCVYKMNIKALCKTLIAFCKTSGLIN